MKGYSIFINFKLMKKILFIARQSDSPYALEHVLDFTENTGSEPNSVCVIKVNVPHYSLIFGALQQIAEKLNSGEFLASAETLAFVQEAINSLENSRTSTPCRELVDFVAAQTYNLWLRPSFCIYADGE